MSIPRRAIIHIGGTRQQIKQRMIKTKETDLLHNTPNDDKFYFTIDLDNTDNLTVLKDEQINPLLEEGQKRPKDLKQVKKINIQIATENEHTLIQKQLGDKQKSEIRKRVKQVKQTLKKKQEDKKKKKKHGIITNTYRL